MTVYIAICDDNIADRKQTERLLEREKDARLKANGDVLYIESFGSSEALLKTPIKYDMFILDVTSADKHGMEIAKMLRSAGIIAPITLLSSVIDYNSFSNAPSRLLNLKKPINQGQISHIVDLAANWASQKPALLEIRGKNDTFFVPPFDLIRASQKSNMVEAVLTNGTYIEIPGLLSNFQKELTAYKCFINCKNSIININHIINLDGNTLTLSNDEKFEFSVLKSKELLSSFIEFSIEQNLGKKL